MAMIQMSFIEYNDLIRKATIADLAEAAYKNSNAYDLPIKMSALFGEKPECETQEDAVDA